LSCTYIEMSFSEFLAFWYRHDQDVGFEVITSFCCHNDELKSAQIVASKNPSDSDNTKKTKSMALSRSFYVLLHIKSAWMSSSVKSSQKIVIITINTHFLSIVFTFFYTSLLLFIWFLLLSFHIHPHVIRLVREPHFDDRASCADKQFANKSSFARSCALISYSPLFFVHISLSRSFARYRATSKQPAIATCWKATSREQTIWCWNKYRTATKKKEFYMIL
jgi:hypothetical protein